MPCAWKALSKASNNLLVMTLMSLALRKGKEEKISTRVVEMFIMWMWQWLFSQIGKKNCLRNEDISINRSVGKIRVFINETNIWLWFHFNMSVVLTHKLRNHAPWFQHQETYNTYPWFHVFFALFRRLPSTTCISFWKAQHIVAN